MAGESVIVLVHNKDNTLRAYFEIEAKDLHFIFPNNELETYWLCKVDKDKYINQINQVEDQKWQTKKIKKAKTKYKTTYYTVKTNELYMFCKDGTRHCQTSVLWKYQSGQLLMS